MRDPDITATIPRLLSIFDLGRQLAALETARRYQDVAWSIVATAAGVDVGEMNWASQRSLRANRFLGLKVAA